jgi:LmbE family N-acetylglucosaminyl deacetylase
MRALRRWVVRALSRQARPYLKSYGLLKTIKYKPALVWEPQGERVLVLAPHMDDEVIGCGGTLVRHVRRGADVTVVFLTDGRYGGGSTDKAAVDKGNGSLVQTRKEEAKSALKTLGINEGIFLDAEDGNLNSAGHLQRELRQLLKSARPEFVYLPFFLEGHPDHRATSQLLLDATSACSFEFDCLGYEVWTPLLSPNCLVGIDEVVEVKKQALQHYTSQLAELDYIHTSLGLNAYRSGALLNQKSRYVEAFFMASLRDYLDLYQKFCHADSQK